MNRLSGLLVVFLFSIACMRQADDSLRIAVASSMAGPATELARAFEKAGHDRVDLSIASSGLLYHQIVSGAEYDLFLSADTIFCAKLDSIGLNSRPPMVYATGKLAIYSSNEIDIRLDSSLLRDVRHLIIPNPKTAPYGWAALSFLNNLGMNPETLPIVYAQNAIEAIHLLRSGAAPMAISSLSVSRNGPSSHYNTIELPPHLYSPIHHSLLSIKREPENPMCQEFLSFLHSESGRAILVNYGFSIP